MDWLRELRRRLGMLLHGRQYDADLEEEMRLHLKLRQQEHLESGMAADAALAAARRRFGNVAALGEESHSAWGWGWFEHLVQDVHYGARVLLRSPGFTTVAVLTLALGIGANTAIFSVLDGILLSPLPYEQPDRLVVMNHNDSLLNLIDIRRQERTFTRGGGINTEAMDYTGGTEPVQVHAGYVDAGFLDTLGVPPMLGRILSPEEDVQGGPHVAVLSYRFWQKYLSSDPHVLGRTIPLSGSFYTVIGVMPKSFFLPREHADVFVSLWVAYPEAAPVRGVHFMHAYWRLKPAVTLTEAQADIAAIDRRLAEQYPASEKGRGMQLVPLHQWMTGDVRTALLVLFGAVGFVLLIACANFAGLLMARAVVRRRELVIRAALGAGRSRLVRQALTESVLLSLIGGVAGLLLAKWGTSAMVSLKPAALERFGGIQMDARVLMFAFGVSILTGVVFGLVPAWSAARAEVPEALKESGRSITAGAGGHHIRKMLVTSELALALMLLVGAGLLVKGFSRLRSVSPGFNPSNVLTMSLHLPAMRYLEIPPQTQFRREVLARLNSLPGAEAAMISDIPLGNGYVSHTIVVAGRPPVTEGEEPAVQTLSVMGNYFRVMQIPIRMGRDFTAMDREGQPLVAIVNEEMVKEFFPHEDPLGARIDWARTQGPHQWMTIVGVAANVKHSGLNQPADPAVYAPFSQSDEAWRRWMTVTIRMPGVSSKLVEEAKKQIWSVDSKIPVSDIQPMNAFLSESLAEQKFDMVLLVLFAALALILAAVGLYGLVAYAVSQRTHEIGIRLALGAQQRDVIRLVVGDGAKLAFFGIGIGVSGALVLTRVMTSLLFEVRPTDPATFAWVTILLAMVAMAACYIPARRAMRVDPMVALRYE